MSPEPVDDRPAEIRRPPLLGVDTMLFIYHFENHEELGPLAGKVLHAAERGDCHLVTSVLTPLEILVVPKRLRLTSLCDRYRELFASFPNLSLQSTDQRTAEIASDLRSVYGIRTPDAIQVATAIQHRADLFVTGDERLQRIEAIKMVSLNELTV